MSRFSREYEEVFGGHPPDPADVFPSSRNGTATIGGRKLNEVSESALEMDDDETENCRRTREEERREDESKERRGESALVPITALWGLKKKYPNLKPATIDGLARIGETVNLVAPTKVGKSWMTYPLMICAATAELSGGRKWLDTFSVANGPSLLIDNELDPSVIVNRIQRVCMAMSLSDDHIRHVMEAIDVLSLRGRLMDIYAIRERLSEIEPDYYKFVFIDANYRTIARGESENDNAAMAMHYNCIDAIAAHLKATVVLVDHATKGNQSDKGVTDVGAGAGSKARAADAHVILREHREPNAYTLEARVRSFAPVSPIVLKWTFPLWQHDPMLDPADLRTTKAKATRPSKEELAERRREETQAKQAVRDADDDRRLLDAVARAADAKKPVSKTTIRAWAGLNSDRLARSLDRQSSILTVEAIEVETGIGQKKPAETIRRKPLSGQSGQSGQTALFGELSGQASTVGTNSVPPLRGTELSVLTVPPDGEDHPGQKTRPDRDPPGSEVIFQ